MKLEICFLADLASEVEYQPLNMNFKVKDKEFKRNL